METRENFKFDTIGRGSHFTFVINSDGKFERVNIFTSSLMGYSDPNTVLGLSYGDMRCEASEFSSDFLRQDQKAILSGERNYMIARLCYAKKQYKTLFGNKEAFTYNNKKYIFANFLDVSQLHFFDVPIIKEYNNRNFQYCYEITSNLKSVSLTKKETVCLFFYLRGYTAKAMGALMDKSDRVMQDHISKIKEKLNCSNRAQVIEKCIETGLYNFIPISIFKKLNIF